MCYGGLGLFVGEAPGEGEDAGEEDDGSEGYEAGVEGRESVDLFEVDESVHDGYYVVDAEDERVEDACRDKFQASVEVVELRKGEGDQSEKDCPGLPSIELVDPVHNGADQELNCRLRHEQRVCGEDTTDAAVCQTSQKPYSRAR